MLIIMNMEKKKYIRNCPQCNKELSYCSHTSLNRAIKFNRPCLQCVCQSFEYREKIKLANIGKHSGINNPFYGKTHSEKTKKKIIDSRNGIKVIEIYKKQCPICNKDMIYNSSDSLKKATQKNTSCKSCPTEERRKNMAIAHIGHKHTEESKRKISLSNKGICRYVHTDEQRKAQSMRMIGKNSYVRTDEWRRKMRIIRLNELHDKGVPLNEDIGAKEWFEKYNRETNSNFKVTSFRSTVGYIADGYDEQRHIWIEFDTKHHRILSKVTKDKIRENNIIKYFKEIGNPLKGFYRFRTWSNQLEKII